MLVVMKCFSYTPQAMFGGVFLITPDVSFSEEFLLHSLGHVW